MTGSFASHPRRFRRRRVLGLLSAALVAAPAGAGAPVHVFAAASLKTALDTVIAAYRGDGTISATYAGSSLLARHIALGAPADIFISANQGWMDDLQRRGRVPPGNRVDLLGNALVLIAPAGAPVALRPAPGFALAAALGRDGRLAMALVDAVPAGIYGREALQSLGVWPEVAPRVAQTDNVRAALRLVATNAAAFGIVYATDVRDEPRVQVVGTFPATTHVPIRYPAALLEGASPGAADFWEFLKGDQARAIFRAHGFTDPENPA